MIINYLEAQVRLAKMGKVQQSVKSGEWARVEFEKKKGAVNEISSIR